MSSLLCYGVTLSGQKFQKQKISADQNKTAAIVSMCEKGHLRGPICVLIGGAFGMKLLLTLPAVQTLPNLDSD